MIGHEGSPADNIHQIEKFCDGCNNPRRAFTHLGQQWFDCSKLLIFVTTSIWWHFDQYFFPHFTCSALQKSRVSFWLLDKDFLLFEMNFRVFHTPVSQTFNLVKLCAKFKIIVHVKWVWSSQQISSRPKFKIISSPQVGCVTLNHFQSPLKGTWPTKTTT